MLKVLGQHDNEDNSSNLFVKHRRTLAKNIESLHFPKNLYMLGTETKIDTINPVLLANHPKNIELWLPSDLPSTSCQKQCIPGLPQLEYQLRFAQATDSLHKIHLLRWLIRPLSMKSQTHITGTQRTATRTRSIFDKTRIKLAQAVLTYRAAQEAITKLAPDEQLRPWKKLLLELNDGDVHGPGPEDSDTSTSHFTQSWVWMTALQTSTSTKDNNIN